MTETELLDAIEHGARSVFHAEAAVAATGCAHARRTARTADVLRGIAAILRRPYARSPGDLRILRSKLGSLVTLLEEANREDLRAELARLHEQLDRLLRDGEADVARAFERKAG